MLLITTLSQRSFLACCAVYGNLSENSGTGVCFSRNPATGERGLWGEYLMNAQVWLRNVECVCACMCVHICMHNPATGAWGVG